MEIVVGLGVGVIVGVGIWLLFDYLDWRNHKKVLKEVMEMSDEELLRDAKRMSDEYIRGKDKKNGN